MNIQSLVNKPFFFKKDNIGYELIVGDGEGFYFLNLWVFNSEYDDYSIYEYKLDIENGKLKIAPLEDFYIDAYIKIAQEYLDVIFLS